MFDLDADEPPWTALAARELAPCQVVNSTPGWIDIMNPGTNKGMGVRILQEALGVSRAQTVVFGDGFNDLEMFGEAGRSFAMSNGHPDVRSAATHVAPSNLEHGVITTLERLLEGGAPALGIPEG